MQNKAGVTIATNLPPSENAMPAYEAGNILVGNIRPYLKKIWFANRNGGSSADVLVFDVNEGYDPKFVCILFSVEIIYFYPHDEWSKRNKNAEEIKIRY